MKYIDEFRDGDDMTATFQLVPGSPFVVEGAKRSADSLVAAAGAELVTEGGVAEPGDFHALSLRSLNIVCNIWRAAPSATGRRVASPVRTV